MLRAGMRRRLAVSLAAAIALFIPSQVRAQEASPARDETADAPPMAFATPRESLVPGRPGMPGGIHLMINGFAEAHNTGIPGHAIDNPGAGGPDTRGFRVAG